LIPLLDCDLSRHIHVAAADRRNDNERMPALEETIKDFAQSIGFCLVGIAPATEADGFHRLRDWLAQDYSGEMAYMALGAEARRHPSSILGDVRSVIMVAMDYAETSKITFSGKPKAPVPTAGAFGLPLNGKVARYAAGADYHEVMWRSLDKLLAWLKSEMPESNGRSVVDTAPLLERDFARRAGLGWIGKNTMLINKQRGSYFFLGALLTNLDLKPDAPHQAEHCGTCTACLDACPTQAFPAAGVLDARRCISYLTIELRGPIPDELREGVGDWLFGCDVCQEVCPWNRHDESQPEAIDAVELLGLDDAAFRQRFRGSAITRAKRRGLLRNAAIVLGNNGDARAIRALEKSLNDSEPLVRDAARWALDRIHQRTRA
jgi:epoxyqueuosine reductase